MVVLSWNIGKIIKSEILQGEKAEYGKSIINSLSKELTNEYGKGYSQANLFNMVRLYEAIDKFEILQTLSVKLTWSHLSKLISIEDDLKQLSERNKMTTDLFFRDPYVLDFLELHDTYSEKDIENAILYEFEKFILEMERDFAFLGRQVRITIGNKDYFIDLLFYHRKLRRLVLIELLEVDKSGIHIAQYLTKLPPKELFQEKLLKAIERAKEKFEAKTLE